MSDFARYNASTGEVLATGQIDDSQIQYQDPTGLYIGDIDGTTQYINVSNGAVVARPTLPAWSATTLAADGTSSITIGPGLPSSTLIVVDVPMNLGLAPVFGYNETSGTFTFKTTVAGKYTITIKPFPYQNVVTSVIAT